MAECDRLVGWCRPAVKTDALEPDQQGLPVDTCDDFQRQERIGAEGTRQRGVGQILSGGGQPRENERPGFIRPDD